MFFFLFKDIFRAYFVCPHYVRIPQDKNFCDTNSQLHIMLLLSRDTCVFKHNSRAVLSSKVYLQVYMRLLRYLFPFCHLINLLDVTIKPPNVKWAYVHCNLCIVRSIMIVQFCYTNIEKLISLPPICNIYVLNQSSSLKTPHLRKYCQREN